MTTVLPPTPPELAARIISDTVAELRIAVEPLAARVADRLDADHRQAMTRGEEIAAEEVDELWDEAQLAHAYARALAKVGETYLRHVALIDEVAGDLEREGRDSWIAQALRHRFACDATWEALDRLGRLTEFDDVHSGRGAQPAALEGA